MGTLHQRAGRRARPWLGLLLAGAILVGCGPGSPADPDLPVPAPPAPGPPVRPSDASFCGPKPFGAEQPPDAWVQFDVTPAQVEVIERRLFRVLCREGLWQKGVGFGINRTGSDGTGPFVMIHPGFSGLTARQIFHRFLGV